MKKIPEVLVFAQLMLCFMSLIFGILHLVKFSQTFLYATIAFQAIAFCIAIYELTQKNTKQ